MAQFRVAQPAAALVGILLAAGLVGCAARPTLSPRCAADAAVTDVSSRMTPGLEASGCHSALMESQTVRLAGIQQTGSRTQTVGVPRGFLIAMIVLLVLLAA